MTTAAWTAAPVVSRVISRTGPLLGIIPDLSRDIRHFGTHAAGRRRRRGALMNLGALTGSGETGPRHRLRDRPPEGRAGHRLRRLPGRAVQRRGFHRRRGLVRRRRRGVAAGGAGRGRGPHLRRRAAPQVRAARRQILRALSRRRSSPSPAPTARPRTSNWCASSGGWPATLRRASARWASPPPTSR